MAAAGDGALATAAFTSPMWLAADATGRVIVADEARLRVVDVAADTVRTLVLADAGTGRAREWREETRLAISAAGSVWLADDTGVFFVPAEQVKFLSGFVAHSHNPTPEQGDLPNQPLSLPETFSFGLVDMITLSTHPARSVRESSAQEAKRCVWINSTPCSGVHNPPLCLALYAFLHGELG